MAVALWPSSADAGDADAVDCDGAAEAFGSKLDAVVGEHPFQPPACGAELACNSADEPRGLDRGRLPGRADDEVCPGVAGGDVDRRQLPDGAAGAVQAADEEAVDADQLAWTLSLDVALRLGLAGRLIGRPVAGHEREPLG